jgi:hypothetical protein
MKKRRMTIGANQEKNTERKVMTTDFLGAWN